MSNHPITGTVDNSFIIENLLHQAEGLRLEFKSICNIDSIAKTITAFINTEGGDLIVGVADNKDILGVENAANEANIIQRTLIERIKPTAPISIQIITYKKKDLILISVWEGANKPYQYKGTIYNRFGQFSKTVTIDKLSSLIQERKRADFHWERIPVLGAEMEDLDIEEINRTIKFYSEYKPDFYVEDEKDFLIQTGLIQNANLTNACVLLFGKKPSRFIRQSRIRLTTYSSPTTDGSYIDDKILDGNIFKNLAAIFDYLDTAYGKSSSVEGVLRTERFNYPLLAIREGILNAVVHRDYYSINGFMQISVFTDRTEIRNYGGLPPGITTKDLRKEHSSILRNPDIALICFIRKYIEMLGSGTLRMIRDCKKNGFKAPEWQDLNNIVKLTFPGLSHNRKNEGVSEGVSEGVKLVIEGVSEGVKRELEDIIDYLKLNPQRKVPEIAEHINKGGSTVERYLKILKDNNLIEFKGAPKTGGYVVKI